MDAVEFLKELEKYCDAVECNECEIGDCTSLSRSNPEKFVEFIEKKSNENPKKTILQDFLEKYPKSPMDEKGLPKYVCPFSLGYEEGDCVQCLTDNCKDCWNRPFEEE